MPNFSAEERRALSGEELELATQSRQPRLGALSDAELDQLIVRLRAARDKARGQGNRQAREARGKADPAGAQPASGNDGTRLKETYIAAALRRASAERSRRRSLAARAAAQAAAAAEATAQPAAAAEAVVEAVLPADPAKKPAPAKKPGTARKPATRSTTTGRGLRAKAAAAVTDRRGSGARKVAKPKPAALPAVVLPGPDEAAAPTAKPAPRRKPAAPVPAAPAPAAGGALAAIDPAPAAEDGAQTTTALVKDLTDKAARRVAKADKARSKADKAARQAEKLGDKKSRKVAKKADEKARKAQRKARKSARQARKAAADLS